MPSRTLTLAVVVFWLGTATWVFFREAYPWLRAGEPPPYVFDMSDEVGANVANWTIFAKGEEIGAATCSIRRRPGKTFELRSEYFFKKGNIAPVELKKISSTYEISTDGELRGLYFQLKVVLPKPLLMEAAGEIRGIVEQERLSLNLTLKLNDQVQDLSNQFKPVSVPLPKRILNPMHLVNRYPGLRAGQRWKEPLFNYMAAIFPTKIMEESLLAEVEAAPLRYLDRETDCLKVSYYGSERRLEAVTWVRRDDALVLQQEAYHGGLNLILKRGPNK